MCLCKYGYRFIAYFCLQSDKLKTLLLAVHIAFTGAFALVLVLVVALNWGGTSM